MIIDCREWHNDIAHERKRVFVNGAEIHEVFYLDTDAGFVLTYDVIGDGKAHLTREAFEVQMEQLIIEAKERDAAAGNCGGWVMPVDGVMHKELRGKVELLPLGG